jgi:imidazolonepropionase-like amidohydrolase
LVGAGAAAAQTVIIEAEQVMTMGPAGTVGPTVIVVRDGVIVALERGTSAGMSIPADAELLAASVVTPGLIDARTTLGLAGVLPIDDANETSGPNQASVRAVDAFDLREPMLAFAVSRGVTVVQSGPGHANSIGGQAGIFRTDAATMSDALIRSPSAIVITLTEPAKTTYAQKLRLPTTRMANVGLIRQALLDTERYRQLRAGSDPPARDLKHEALARLLEGEIPAVVAASRVDEISTALRLAEEFGFRMVIAGAADAHLVVDQLAEADIPVLYSPPGDDLYESASPASVLSVPALLAERGVTFALVSGDAASAPRTDLLSHAARAVREGLSAKDAMQAITSTPARLLGIDDRFGSIEISKVADLVLLTGDPFDATSRIHTVLIGGRVVHHP